MEESAAITRLTPRLSQANLIRMADPAGEKPKRPPGRIRLLIAWIMVAIGINPGFKPWEENKPDPSDKS